MECRGHSLLLFWSFIYCASFIHASDVGWHCWCVEALLQVPALVNVCGNHLWCCTDEETALSTSAGIGLQYRSDEECFFVRSILQVVAFHHWSNTACWYSPLTWVGEGSATDYSADTIDVDWIEFWSSFDWSRLNQDRIHFVVRMYLYDDDLHICAYLKLLHRPIIIVQTNLRAIAHAAQLLSARVAAYRSWPNNASS